jgi:hypothetical protein
MFTLKTARGRLRVYFIVLAILVAIAIAYKLTHIPAAASDVVVIE